MIVVELKSYSLTASVLEEALLNDTSVIISYHPPIFKSMKSLTLFNPIQTSLLHCAAQGISVYSPHSALDSVWGGITDWLADAIVGDDPEAGSVKPLIGGATTDDTIDDGAAGRLVTLNSPMMIDVLVKRIKSHLKLSQSEYEYISHHVASHSTFPMAPVQVGYASRSSPVKRIAICAGSGGSMLSGKQADAYFTGEMSHVTNLFLPYYRLQNTYYTCIQARGFGCSRGRQARHSM